MLWKATIVYHLFPQPVEKYSLKNIILYLYPLQCMFAKAEQTSKFMWLRNEQKISVTSTQNKILTV